MLTLSSVLFCIYGIATGNETGIPSDVLGDPLALCETIISSLNCSPRSPLTKMFFLVIIEALIIYTNDHENMVLHATPSSMERETVTSCLFTTKGVL